MRLASLLTSCLMLLCILLVSLPGLALSAEDAAQNSPEPPEVTGPVPAFKRREQAKRLDERVYFVVTYPEFGIAFLDKEIQAYVNNFVNQHGGFKDFKLEKDEDGVLAREILLGYDLYAAKPGVLSIKFSSWIYLGGPGGHPSSDAVTYDLRAQKQLNQLNLGDIFPRWETSKKRLLPVLKGNFEDFDKECSNINLEEMLFWENGSFYLEPEGLTLLIPGIGYAPADKWSCGAFFADKQALKEIGADMRWWGKN